MLWSAHLVSEQVSAGDVSPAVLGLQSLTLGAPPTARPAHHPDHRGQGLLHLEILGVCCQMILTLGFKAIQI